MKIFESKLLEWPDEKFPAERVLQDENAPAHASEVANKWCKYQRISLME